jgi:phage terminase large subunit
VTVHGLLDYIEGIGQPLAYYAGELRRRGWKEAVICLPHDGVATNNITGKRYIDHWREAGFKCETPIKNTGAGAAMMRIEAARRIFPRCWFNKARLRLDGTRSAITTSVATRTAT